MFYNTKYLKSESISFKKVNEKWGDFSNMSNLPVKVNGIIFKNTEMLYQVMRFTEYPEIQRELINQKSPMSVKMISKKYRKQGFTRKNWGDENVKSINNNDRVKIMEWCLRLKLRDNFKEISALLLASKNLDIIEYAPRKSDIFWELIQ